MKSSIQVIVLNFSREVNAFNWSTFKAHVHKNDVS